MDGRSVDCSLLLSDQFLQPSQVGFSGSRCWVWGAHAYYEHLWKEGGKMGSGWKSNQTILWCGFDKASSKPTQWTHRPWCKNCALECLCQTGMAMALYSFPSSLGRKRADKWRLSADDSWTARLSLKGNLNGTFLCLPQHLRETGYKSRPYMLIISNKECVSKLVSTRGSSDHLLMRDISAQPARQNI